MRGLRKTDANLNNEPIEGWNVIRKVTPYLWPEGDTAVKVRVVLPAVKGEVAPPLQAGALVEGLGVTNHETLFLQNEMTFASILCTFSFISVTQVLAWSGWAVRARIAVD